MSWKDWSSVYKLSDMWFIGRLLQQAIDHIRILPRNSDEWVAVLRWSTKQHIPEVRAKAIQTLDQGIGEARKIELARECNVASWLLTCYKELAERYDEVSAEEEERLGQQATSKLFQIREQFLRNQFMRNIGDLHAAYDTESAICADFEAELKAAVFVD